jgi:hypothetical protein
MPIFFHLNQRTKLRNKSIQSRILIVKLRLEHLQIKTTARNLSSSRYVFELELLFVFQ